ncbi:MAG: hypothetical protein RLZZ612_291 [Pseudomonadota bacterium]|jgi:uncharacterized protein (DUF58 family)
MNTASTPLPSSSPPRGIIGNLLHEQGWRSPRLTLQRWFESRLARTDRLLLTQRNVYILPTRPGWMLGVTLMVMLIGSINYQLNLGYLLTFLLAGAAVVSIHICHNTLRGLTLKLSPPQPCFAGGAARLEVSLMNDRRKPRYGLGVARAEPPEWSYIDIPALGSASVEVGWSPPQRGRHHLPTLTVETRFPLGTFRVWTVWRPAATVLVYPQPEAHPPPLPAGMPKATGAAASPYASHSTEYDGVRAYRRGDPLKAVVWKRAAQAMARGSADLVSRDVAAHSSSHELWLDWQHTGTQDEELRVSRLTAWVLLADRLGLDYGLRLPHLAYPPSQGGTHRLQCLEALALC